MNQAPPDAERYMGRVDALLHEGVTSLSPLGAGLLVAIDMGITDSRSFSRLLAVEHALVLREIAELSGPDGFIVVTGRHPKTMRTTVSLSPRARALPSFSP